MHTGPPVAIGNEIDTRPRYGSAEYYRTEM